VSIAVLVAQIERFLPPGFSASREILAGVAAALDRARQVNEDLALASTIGGAEGKWLTLMARGYGLSRATHETDVSVRRRLRNVEDRLTCQAILDAVNRLLEPYTATEAVLYEWFDEDGAFWLDFDFLDDQRILGEWNTFYLFVPLLGEAAWGDAFLDDAFLDDAFLGAGPEHPVYPAIVAEVERLRAAGVRWLMILE